MKQSDIGIFLHRTNFSESSAIVSYFTKEHGFQKFVFLGAKKKKTPLFPLAIHEIDYYIRQDSELGKLTSAQIHGQHLDFPFHPIDSSMAFFIAEILSKCLSHTEKDISLFEFLSTQIDVLDSGKIRGLFPIQFILGLLQQLGLEPHMEHPNPIVLDLEEGTFHNNPRMQNAISGIPMQLVLSILQNDTLPQHDKAIRKEALLGLIKYLQYHIDGFGQLRSFEILETLYSA